MDRRYLPPATFAAVSAALHLIALPVSGPLLPAALGAMIWAALAYGLFRAFRAVAYLAFLMGLFGIIAALSIAMGLPVGLGQWIWFTILAADGLVAVTLFFLLWTPRAA